ncbi:heat shock protein beta-6 isoform 1-T2 [Clarias gariepinus]|uniref:heat shock protein beta-6 n=1 Tax=Clarias gariepinus TaxID=13013 RepID=UPI00234C9BC3|nr:heat shock protein beta-6 [Clarias gariepinus]XP_053362684.1 heat shock protein beta-6 [Clarias gariepinus]
MAFDLHPSAPLSGIIWEKVLPPMLPRLGDTLGSCAWTPSELLIPVKEHTGAAQVVCDQNGFTVQLDVKHFNPDELMVKVKGDYVVVEGKHEQKKDGSGLVTREFNRRYRIPNEVDAMNLECAVSPEGMLVISAPLLKVENAESPTHSVSGV